MIDAHLDIRHATMDDMDLVFEWSNDPLVRENSFHSDPIDYKKHCNWYANRMQSDKSHFFIVHKDKCPLGLVRFEKDSSNTALVGVLVAPEYRGKGVSKLLLSLAITTFQKTYTNIPIHAYIKKSNTPSIMLFERVGFTFLREDINNDIECLVYEFPLSKAVEV